MIRPEEELKPLPRGAELINIKLQPAQLYHLYRTIREPMFHTISDFSTLDKYWEGGFKEHYYRCNFSDFKLHVQGGACFKIPWEADYKELLWIFYRLQLTGLLKNKKLHKLLCDHFYPTQQGKEFNAKSSRVLLCKMPYNFESERFKSTHDLISKYATRSKSAS
jgi:hypothetical protein